MKRIYQENWELKQQRDSVVAQSEIDVRKAQEEKSRAVTRLKEFEALVNERYTSSEGTQKALVDAQRNLVVLKVNEETLTRRYVTACESEVSLQKEVTKLKVTMILFGQR